MKMKKALAALAVAFAFVLSPGVANAATTPEPTPTPMASASVNRVLDNDGFFTDQQKQELNEGFDELTAKYGILPVVEVIPTLNGEDPQKYAIRRANELGVGDANADNGLYIMLTEVEHELRVEPGIGLAREVSKAEIQSVVNNTFIPAFKQNNFVRGILNGVDEIGKYSLPGSSGTVGGPVSSGKPFDFTPIWATLGGLLAAGLAAFGGWLGWSHKKRKEEEAEAARKAQLEEQFNKALQRLEEESLRKTLLTANNSGARLDKLADLLTYAPFTTEERAAYSKRLDEKFIGSTVDFGGIPQEFYKSRLNPDESLEGYIARVKAEKPEAVKRQEAYQAEQRRLAQVRKDAESNWRGLSKSEQESFALAEGSERKKFGETLFPDYANEEARKWYSNFAEVKADELKREAKRSFDSLPRHERERIARASTYERERLLQDSISGYNPALLGVYIASSTVFMDQLRADEARAAQDAASAASYSSNSFGSFDSGSSFGGGGFDGGGGGGSW